MRIGVIGAGAMGSTYGGLLSLSGHDVHLFDVRQDVVGQIMRHGLKLDGVCGPETIKIKATTDPNDIRDVDLVMIWTDTNNTRNAAELAGSMMSSNGFAITLQNGIGNIEILTEVLGAQRVVAGSSMCSAALAAPGNARFTHKGMTSVGELDGRASERVTVLADALRQAGFDVDIRPDILSLVWTKFALNCSINALCAVTGLRMGELARVPATNAFQDLIIDEILNVIAACGITLTDPHIRNSVKKHSFMKYSRPSMLQAIETGKRTEIDSLNLKIVEEGRKRGIPTPFNEALVMMLKGVEFKATIARGRTEADYAALEEKAATEPFNS